MSVEKRREPRVRGTHQLMAKFLSPTNAEGASPRVLFCSTEDLSRSGLRLIADRDLPVGSRVWMNLGITDPPRSFRHVGLVRWVVQTQQPPGFAMGIEFTETAEATAWQEFIERLIPPPRPGTTFSRAYAKEPGSVWDAPSRR
jgi:hypothetical protein